LAILDTKVLESECPCHLLATSDTSFGKSECPRHLLTTLGPKSLVPYPLFPDLIFEKIPEDGIKDFVESLSNKIY